MPHRRARGGREYAHLGLPRPSSNKTLIPAAWRPVRRASPLAVW